MAESVLFHHSSLSPGRNFCAVLNQLVSKLVMIVAAEQLYAAFLYEDSRSVLCDEKIVFENWRKRMSFQHLFAWYTSRTWTESQLLDLAPSFNKIYNAYKTLHSERLHWYATEYFSRKFPSSNFEVLPKVNGVQEGIRLRVDGVTYFVKSHSNGSVKSSGVIRSDAPRGVDPIELYSYIVLHMLGIGCEPHFFGKDNTSCYIATKNAECNGEYKDFSNVDMTALFGKSFVDGVRAKCPNVESIIAASPRVSHAVDELFVIEMACRLLGFSDVLSNTSNFGFLLANAEKPTALVIDFRVEEVYDFEVCDAHAVLKGFNKIRFAKEGSVLQYCLQCRPLPARVASARKTIETRLQNIGDVLERALENFPGVLSFIEDADVKLTLIETVRHHADIVRRNFTMLQDTVDRM